MPRVMRTTRNSLQAPMEVWTNGSRLIHLIGMSHVADPRFYADTARILAELEEDGAVVYAEGVRYADGTVPGRKILETLVIHEIFGDLVHQTIALPNQKRWRNVDLTVEELLDHSDDPVALEMLISPNLSVHDRRSATTVGALMRPALVPVLSLAGRFAGAGRIAHEHAVLDLRNELVLDAVLAEDHDAVLIWGAAHLPGMGRILAAAGYELVARTWRPVMARQRIIDGIRAARESSVSTDEWPWEGQDLPAAVPATQARALLRERGWLTDPVPA